MMRRIAIGLIMLAAAGCGRSAVDKGDGFAPGKWQLEAWLEMGQASTRGQPAAGRPEVVSLTAAQALAPPATVFFSQFYHGEKDWPNVRFRDGTVSGSLEHGQSSVPVSGTYSRDHFRVALRFGATVDQVIEGKLIGPAG
jgi:hypothetical protein